LQAADEIVYECPLASSSAITDFAIGLQNRVTKTSIGLRLMRKQGVIASEPGKSDFHHLPVTIRRFFLI
jgi:hypothetical protein